MLGLGWELTLPDPQAMNSSSFQMWKYGATRLAAFARTHVCLCGGGGGGGEVWEVETAVICFIKSEDFNK